MQWPDGFDYSQRGGFPFMYNPDVMSTLGQNVEEPSDNERLYLHSTDPAVVPNKASDIPGIDVEFWEAGNCIEDFAGDTRACLQHFFNESTPQDVLYFSFGMAFSHLSKKIDMKAWYLNSAINFTRYLAATFKGIIFRATNAHMRGKYSANNPALKDQEQSIWR